MLNRLKLNSEFSRNVLTLMTGTTIAQAIPIAISPILTRIYTPKDFGIFALYISISSIFATIATGRYELAIMLPKKDEDAINIVVLSIILSLVISLLTFIIVFFFNSQITAILGNEEIKNWLYFIPLTVLLTGIYQAFNYWSNRKKQYRRLVSSKVIQSTTTATTNLSLGFSGLGSNGLIFGGILGQAIATSVLIKMVLAKDKAKFKYTNKLKVFALAKKYKKLPFLSLPNALIDAIRVSGINILMTTFYSVTVLGQFSLAWKMIQVPMGIVGASLAQVFFQKVATTDSTHLMHLTQNLISKSILVAMPIFLIIYFFATDIFIIVFGKEWVIAGEIASILTPWLFLNFLTSPLGNIFIVLNKQEIVLGVSVLYMLLPLSILWFFHNLDFLLVLKIITYTMSLILIAYIALVFIYIKKENKNDL